MDRWKFSSVLAIVAVACQINAWVVADGLPGTPPPPVPAGGLPAVVRSLDDCNVVWNSPSGTSFGSMPLGNGDVGANVWVDKTGDLLFYISKVDAYDAGHLLPKLGCVRLHAEPALDVAAFRQSLVLRDAAVTITAGDANLRVWIDANAEVMHVEGSSATPRTFRIAVEPLRALADAGPALANSGTVGVLFADKADRLAWCYRNQSSAWAGNLNRQNTSELVAKTQDPILHRSSGCLVQGRGFVRDGRSALRSAQPTKSIDCSIRVLSSQPQDVAAWLAEAERPVASSWAAHQAYWRSFWDRSHIFISGCGTGSVNLDQCRYTQFAQGSKAYDGHKLIDAGRNAFQISQRYALERFCEAVASRGQVPPPYNGSIFTMDMPAGVLGFDAPKGGPVSPDGRDWASLSFMWQNTRHPYWSMAARGDYDTLRPGMQFVRDGLDICRDHCKKLLGIEGAFIMEASWWHNVGVFNWDRMPGHLRFHQIASVELPAIMCEYYEQSREAKFLNDVLLPCADEFIAYYANRFVQRDAGGRMLMAGVGCAETYQGVDNPCTEIGCLKFLMTKLLSFEINPQRRQRWTRLLAEMPGVPTRRVRGLDLLAVGDAYGAGREICESPELYSVYPFRQAWLGTPPLLDAARQSFHVRTVSLDGTDDKQAVETGGWQSSPVQAAYLGLPREAARLASINFNDQFIHWNDNIDPTTPWPARPRPRFPAFWECKMDGTPDNDHGANSANALQSMLLQSNGRAIYLLPAWPDDWDVSFKLCAPDKTTVECEYRDGRVQVLRVTPQSRQADVVDMSSLANRIRTLVGVACADRNYLFGLPPMLDAEPKPGKTTAAWLKKYGESVTDVRAAPWPGCVFRDKVLYVHRFDGGDMVPPPVPATLVSSKLLTDTNEQPDTILKLEYDRSLEPFALAAPSQGSLTAGRTPVNGEVDLGQAVTFARIELTIDNPGHRRGQGHGFTLEAKQADGTWKTAFQGTVYGSIFSKRFAPLTARQVRLKIDVPVRQLDLFPVGQ